MTQLRIPAVYMRGGTSKGVFFVAEDLPSEPAARDRLLMRVVGSPDPYGKQIDGMGGATSSTSKVVVVARPTRPGFDLEYRFGQVAIDAPLIDWSGNCGNLTAAVGPFAIARRLVAVSNDGIARLRMWQADIRREIVAHVPVRGGEPVEEGTFALDGVAFPAAEIALEFVDPAGTGDGRAGGPLPTGRPVDVLDVAGVGRVEASLVDAGNPAVFIDARALGLDGTELQPDVNTDAALLARAEAIRAAGAVAMGLAGSVAEATTRRPHTPKLACVARPADYRASDGRQVRAQTVDLVARIFSMGVLHHAMTGTGGVALAVAAAVPGTIVARVATPDADGWIRFGHPSGVLRVGAEARAEGGRWLIARVMMSRSARRLMEGWVRVPAGRP